MNHTKKINVDGINQQAMDAVTATIASSIKINVQRIFKQYTKLQQPLSAKLTSVHSASTSMRKISRATEQSINKQSFQCLQAKRTVSASNAHSVNNIELNINVNAFIVNINA